MTAAVATWLRAGQRIVAAELRRGGWLRFGQFRWQDMDVPTALRVGVGMITPLVVGIAVGHAEDGVFASLGSLPAGFVSFQGVSRTRVSAVVLASAGMAAATFVGATASHTDGWLLLPAVVVVSYLAGLLVALGSRFSVIGLQSIIQLVIASDIPQTPNAAAIRAGFVFAGGLWQGVLVVASWTLRRGGQERAALAATYRDLSGYAAGLRAGPADTVAGPPRPAAFQGTDVLRDPNPLLSTDTTVRLLQLLDQAERIRASLAALALGTPPDGLLAVTSRVLDELADTLDAGRDYRRHAASLRQALDAVEPPGGGSWRWAGQALLGQLRAAIRILGRLDDAAAPDAPETIVGERRAAQRATAALPVLRDNAGVATEAGRHALRLAVVAGLGELIAEAAGLPHGYWVVLTIAIVLKPDYASTIYRGVQRAAGTVVGAGLGVATALLLHVGTAALVAAIGVTMTVAYAVFAVNYMLYAVFLTDFVIALLALLGEPADTTALARLTGTGIGAALAIVGYLAWPTWVGETAPQQLARLFQTQAHYAAALLRACASPEPPDHAALRAAQAAARTARFDAEAAADRLADEPKRPPMTTRLAFALTAAVRRFALAALTLHAAIEGSDTEHADRGAAAAAIVGFADGLLTAADSLARSLRTLSPPIGMPPLRELQTALFDAVSRAGDPAVDGALLTATDEFTDAFDTSADALRTLLAPDASAGGADRVTE